MQVFPILLQQAELSLASLVLWQICLGLQDFPFPGKLPCLFPFLSLTAPRPLALIPGASSSTPEKIAETEPMQEPLTFLFQQAKDTDSLYCSAAQLNAGLQHC